MKFFTRNHILKLLNWYVLLCSTCHQIIGMYVTVVAHTKPMAKGLNHPVFLRLSLEPMPEGMP